jgi:pyrroline-5-carboxylate reductase
MSGNMRKKLAIIGCGKMGQALLKGLITSKTYNAKDIFVSDKLKSRLSAISRNYKVKVFHSNTDAASNADIILLSVKPQDIGCLLAEITGIIKNKLVVSIAAGITTGFIKKQTGAKKVARAMPNMPVLVGSGITALSFSAGFSASDKNKVQSIFNCVGTTITIKERHMDAVTAVSGSGPAYVFYLIEAMAKAAVSLGLDKNTARRLVSSTVFGSSLLQHSLNKCPVSLRKDITSKGGTTEAAIKIFDKRGLDSIIKEAISAACTRSKQLIGNN